MKNRFSRTNDDLAKVLLLSILIYFVVFILSGCLQTQTRSWKDNKFHNSRAVNNVSSVNSGVVTKKVY